LWLRKAQFRTVIKRPAPKPLLRNKVPRSKGIIKVGAVVVAAVSNASIALIPSRLSHILFIVSALG
jgi:hypothetical protein